MSRFLAIIAFLLISVSMLGAQRTPGFFNGSVFTVNPGIRLVFGNSGPNPVAVGFELSAGFLNEAGPVIAGVVNYDIIDNRKRLHFGAEVGYGPFGLDVGPTLFFDEGGTKVATTISPYLWLGVIPFYSYTIMPDEPDMSEWGLAIKFPMRPDGEEWSYGLK